MNAIEIKGLCKSYGDFSLDRLDLTLPGGCVMGLVGENGAGKTTTIKLILGLIHKDAGTVKILGRDNSVELELTKEDIGVVLDEIGMTGCLTAGQIDRIMALTYKRWNSEQFFAYLDKLSVPENKQFREMSRGTKMKLGIAVALSHGAKLLILDEATGGLDPVVRDEVISLFSDFTRAEDHAILMSSHIVSDLEKLCDYIAFLHKGRLLLCEEKDRLYEEYGIIRCPVDTLESLDPAAVVGKKLGPYGAEAIVRRGEVPSGIQIRPIDIEELFIFMVKEAG